MQKTKLQRTYLRRNRMLSEMQGDNYLREQERRDAALEAREESQEKCYMKAYASVYPLVRQEVMDACMMNALIPEGKYGRYAAGYAAVNAVTYAVEDLEDIQSLIRPNGDITKIYAAYAHYVANEEAEYVAERAVAALEILMEGDEV
jgi:membrane carboxypeptidase/penicillin-binding protein